MSAYTDNFECQLKNIIANFSQQPLPEHLPLWVRDLGISSSNKIVKAERVGSSGYKTDIIVHFDNHKLLKISAKMSSADYFGNWYSHKRLVNEFGLDSFEKLTQDCTKWANAWINHSNASLFVGVSICFGKRSGNTSRDFLDVFNPNDMIKIVAGIGTGNETANCLYSTSNLPSSIEQLFQILKPINTSTIFELSHNFKIAYRPINPMTEDSNRKKCVYTQFVPFKAFAEPLEVTHVSDLKTLGSFQTVEFNSLNHNRILNNLSDNFNLIIPRKVK
ncbi:hypothetical protein [Acinetobacter larvae]|uniref:Uncharacterized protein n=1 Tax=Acinetobacter larvae TaxID=1789224 RepID=A0A1B2LVF7_9GAMM|nr:hypothetical protein [Acinetobacter larvae]AOA56921.1 hypothetical protein BFG52_00135 [Acinetobacter larvae]